MLDKLKVSGNVKLEHYNKEGNLIETKEFKNLIVSAGKDFIAQRMKDDITNVMSHMAVGTGDTAATLSDTTLETEIDRNALDSTTVTNNDVTYVATYPAGDATGALTEAGIFNAASGGVMLCRTVFPVVNKSAGDSVTITWTITVG